MYSTISGRSYRPCENSIDLTTGRHEREKWDRNQHKPSADLTTARSLLSPMNFLFSFAVDVW
jgi:hypothetical protein